MTPPPRRSQRNAQGRANRSSHELVNQPQRFRLKRTDQICVFRYLSPLLVQMDEPDVLPMAVTGWGLHYKVTIYEYCAAVHAGIANGSQVSI